jgi:hypothetical protein
MQLTSGQRDFILAHEREDVRETALRFAREDMPLLLAQIAGRQAAEKKIPSWYAEAAIFYPPHLSLEQSSSELTARYKASLLSENNEAGLNFSVTETLRTPAMWKNGAFADLTGGMGVDFSFMARHFREAVYVERSEELCRIAEHNFGVLGLKNATVRCAGAERFLKETSPLDLIYLDPSRRDDAGRKLFRIADCSPGLPEIKPLLFEKSDRVMVKYSPMLDISLAVKSLGCVREVHVVSVENECKELLFLLSKTVEDKPVKELEDEPLFIAVNLKRSGERERFSFTMAQEQDAAVTFAGEPGLYLYEPNASILKAGAFRSVARMYALRKLHVNSHLYTSDKLVENFPGRIFKVEAFFTPNRKNIKAFSQETKKANITVRNFPATVAEIRRKTGLEDGGDTYLFATTLAGERRVWVKCGKVY